jgi:hypothetical protein
MKLITLYHKILSNVLLLTNKIINSAEIVRSSYAWQLVDSSDHLQWEEFINTMANEINCHILFPRVGTAQQHSSACLFYV